MKTAELTVATSILVPRLKAVNTPITMPRIVEPTNVVPRSNSVIGRRQANPSATNSL